MFTDEVAREGTSLAGHLIDGVKIVGKGVIVSVPVVATGIKNAIDFSAPYVQQGVNTATPIVQRYASKALEVAVPVVQDFAGKALEVAAPLSNQAAEEAMAALQPYLDASQTIPESLLEQAKASAGDKSVEAALKAADQTKSGVAGALRNAAAFLDGNSQQSNSAPSVLPPPVPKTGLLSIQTEIEARVEAQTQAAMAPIIQYEKDLALKVTEFAALTGAGLVGLAFVKR
jgi:hypothetical protein